MRKLGKVFSSLLVSFVVAALSVSPAYATAIARNVNVTDSWAWVEATEDTEIVVDGFNWAEDVGWSIDTEADTGGNVVGGGGWIDTGPALVLTDVSTEVNSTGVLGAVDLGGQTLAENDTITDSSWVWADASKTSYLEVETLNGAFWVGSIIDGYVNSGENTAVGGSGGSGGTIYTGAAGFGAISETTANDSFFDVFVDMSGDTTAQNLDVVDSTAYANASSEVGVGVYTSNWAILVGNVVSGEVNSGVNEASGGDGFDGGDGGVIYTGVAGAAVLADTTANSNSITVTGDVGGSTTARNMDVADSEVYANADSATGILVVNDNMAFGGNLISVGANSGWNEANGGDGDVVGGDGGLISTGDAGILVSSSVEMNNNETLVAGNFGGNVTAESLGIDSSYAEAGVDTGTFVEVINLNDVYAVNSVEAYANTGGNEANGGEDEGDEGTIYTGDALLLAETDTVVNTSETYVVGDFTGNATAGNSFIADSEVVANADSSSEVLVVNDNGEFGGADVSTSLLAEVNTGGNTANGNDDGGEIYTGDAVLVTDVGTTVNSSTTTVVGAGGGNATVSNAGVSGSSVMADASSTGSTTVVNTNSAEVETSVATSVNTGNNDTSGSSSGGEIYTGDAVNETLVSTTVNTNDTTVVVEQGNASASNTGVSGSSATATADSSTSTTVTNTNDAEVVNNVSTSNNTGGNTAIDGGSVSTGGAVTSTTGSTSANTNTITLVVTH